MGSRDDVLAEAGDVTGAGHRFLSLGGLTAHQFLAGAVAGIALLVSVFALVAAPGSPTKAVGVSAVPTAPPFALSDAGADPAAWRAERYSLAGALGLTLQAPFWSRAYKWEDLFDNGRERPEPSANGATRTVSIKRNGTLGQALNEAGVAPADGQAAIVALTSIIDLRRLKVGQKVILNFAEQAEAAPSGEVPRALVSVVLPLDVDREVVAQRTGDGGYLADEVEIDLRRQATRSSGRIDDSLFLAASRAGLPTPIIMEMIRLFSWDVDFQRDIQPGDDFEVLFETYLDANDRPVKTGVVLYAALTLGDTRLSLYRHELADGRIEYFDHKGRAVKKALLRTPINGARLSSHYGKRKHPILGYNKMHRGVDFAAPRGTPILAAGDGVIEWAGRNGAYGKYVRIRHNSRYKTAYAHLKAFAKGIRGGKRVRQGQAIGYVGSTGRSTGPHLHYEVLVQNKRTNPMKVKLPSGEVLRGRELAWFIETQREIRHALLRAPHTSQLASNQ